MFNLTATIRRFLAISLVVALATPAIAGEDTLVTATKVNVEATQHLDAKIISAELAAEFSAEVLAELDQRLSLEIGESLIASLN